MSSSVNPNPFWLGSATVNIPNNTVFTTLPSSNGNSYTTNVNAVPLNCFSNRASGVSTIAMSNTTEYALCVVSNVPPGLYQAQWYWECYGSVAWQANDFFETYITLGGTETNAGQSVRPFYTGSSSSNYLTEGYTGGVFSNAVTTDVGFVVWMSNVAGNPTNHTAGISYPTLQKIG